MKYFYEHLISLFNIYERFFNHYKQTIKTTRLFFLTYEITIKLLEVFNDLNGIYQVQRHYTPPPPPASSSTSLSSSARQVLLLRPLGHPRPLILSSPSPLPRTHTPRAHCQPLRPRLPPLGPLMPAVPRARPSVNSPSSSPTRRACCPPLRAQQQDTVNLHNSSTG